MILWILLLCCSSSSGVFAYLYNAEPKVKFYTQMNVIKPMQARLDPVNTSECDKRYGADYEYPQGYTIGGKDAKSAYDTGYKSKCSLAKGGSISATDFRKNACKPSTAKTAKFLQDWNKGIKDACAIIAPI
jgi:hypothetical protein